MTITNDGATILNLLEVEHPAAKVLVELAQLQDQEVGDGTTSVIILSGEVLAVSEQFLQQHMHPTLIISAYRQALEDAINVLRDQIR